jgi:cyclase
MNYIGYIHLENDRAKLHNASENRILLSDAVSFAVELEEVGFNTLLLRDLDAAKNGQFTSLQILEEISHFTQAEILISGGVRSIEQAEQLFRAGASKLILHSLPLLNLERFQEMIDVFGSNSFILGVDLNEEGLWLEGRTKPSSLHLAQVLDELTDWGIQSVFIQFMNSKRLKHFPSLEVFSSILDFDRSIDWIVGEGSFDLAHLDQLNTLGIQSLSIGDEFFTNESLFLGLKHRIV